MHRIPQTKSSNTEDIIWDSWEGTDSWRRSPETNNKPFLTGQKHLSVLHFLPGQNKLNLQFTESSARSGSSLCTGRTCCGREEEIPGCYSAVFTAPDSMAFRNEGFDVAQHTHAVICLSALSKFIGIVKSCLTQWGNMEFIPGDGVEHFDSLNVTPEKHELPSPPHLLGNYCTSL